MLLPEFVSKHALVRGLDALAEGLSDAASVFSAWPALRDLTQSALARFGPPGRSIIREHRISVLARHDPFTRWSYERPRGYPGDARLIDFIYGHQNIRQDIESATPLGRSIYTYTFEADCCVAVRERCRILAKVIDEAIDRCKDPKILALASGHLREIHLVKRANQISRFMAVDQDAESLREIEISCASIPSIIPIRASIGRFIVRPKVHGCFDLIYAAGLFDYLDESAAKRLIFSCFTALEPGGIFFLSNFSTNFREAGYMDVFMNWQLIQRTEQQIQEILDEIPTELCKRKIVFQSANGVIHYAMIQRTETLRE